MPSNIYITIDVECMLTRAGVIETVFCKSGSDNYGIPMIMDLLDEYGYKGIFFCDTTMKYLLDEERAAEIHQYIHNRGHQVQLHIHPMHMLRSTNGEGCNLAREKWSDHIGNLPESLQEQLIQDGIEQIHQHTGLKPIAFRAGNYGAKVSTLPILKKHGIHYDSSYNLWTRSSRNYYELMLDDEVNSPFLIHDLVEFPATVFYIGNHTHNQYRFFAPEGASLAEMKYALDRLERAGVTDIVLVLHSFTFVKAANKPRQKLLFNKLAYNRFKQLLQIINTDSRFNVTTFDSIDTATLPKYPALDKMVKIEIPGHLSFARNVEQVLNKIPI